MVTNYESIRKYEIRIIRIR